MHQIFSRSFITNGADKVLSRPVAKLTAAIARRPWLQSLVEKTTGVFVIDVEKDVDRYYKSFAVVKAEIADRKRLSGAQRYAISNDPRYRDAETLYLVTMVGAPEPKTGMVRQRELLFDDRAYDELGIEKPSLDSPVGTGQEVVRDTIYDIGTKGQKAFAMVPRVHELANIKTDINIAQKINASMTGPNKPSRRMKIGFMGPKAT